MSDIETRLYDYVDLPPEAQQALVEEVTRTRPDLSPLLADMQVLAAAFGAATGQGAAATEVLARLAARDHINGEARPHPVRARFDTDADLRNQFYTLRDRVEALESQLPDPAAQFSALTGHRLHDHEAPSQARIHALRPPVARVAAPAARVLPLRARMTRYAAAASFALIALYGALAIASRASVSELDRLGALDADALVVEGFGGAVRGSAPEADLASTEARYLQALSILRQARQSTLGLFPSYDEAALLEARALLENVVDTEEEGSFLQLEASYALGKTLLLLGEVPAARTALDRVNDFGGRHAADAVRILASLEARYPAD